MKQSSPWVDSLQSGGQTRVLQQPRKLQLRQPLIQDCGYQGFQWSNSKLGGVWQKPQVRRLRRDRHRPLPCFLTGLRSRLQMWCLPWWEEDFWWSQCWGRLQSFTIELEFLFRRTSFPGWLQYYEKRQKLPTRANVVAQLWVHTPSERELRWSKFHRKKWPFLNSYLSDWQ